MVASISIMVHSFNEQFSKNHEINVTKKWIISSWCW